jgi:hypothetical protein
MWLYGPVTQWADYHAFADSRSWLGIPNAANVLSNLPFLAVGAWGLWRIFAHGAIDAPARSAWQAFCIALVATAAGSAFYHWSPDNATLVTDRIPIAWACAALVCGLLAERVDARWGAPQRLAGALLAATGTVLYWWLTERRGLGDLRPYLFIQILPMLLVPAVFAMRLPPRHAGAAPASAWWAVLGLYAAAKAAELADHWLLAATRLASGHTLKHLLAAAGALWLVHAATRRLPGATAQLR